MATKWGGFFFKVLNHTTLGNRSNLFSFLLSFQKSHYNLKLIISFRFDFFFEIYAFVSMQTCFICVCTLKNPKKLKLLQHSKWWEAAKLICRYRKFPVIPIFFNTWPLGVLKGEKKDREKRMKTGSVNDVIIIGISPANFFFARIRITDSPGGCCCCCCCCSGIQKY